MYTTDAPMATEEYTGTNTMNSSPSKMPTTARSNLSAANGHGNPNAANAVIRRKGLPWVLSALIVLVLLLLVIIGYLLKRLYDVEEQYPGFYTAPFPSSTLPSPLPTEHHHLKWPEPNTRTLEGHFAKAAVVSENGICSEIGRDVLIKGGNAVDAAIAVSVCIGGLNPHSAGLGGGFLMTYYHRFYGKCISIDARETAPSRTSKDVFNENPSESTSGYKSVAVPGELHGYWTAFKRYGSGKIAWMDLLMPTVNLLSEGFPTSKLMELNLKAFEESIVNGSHPGMRNQFVNPLNGELYREGEIMRDPELAETYKRLALSHDPVQLFYSANGEMARAIVDEFGQNGGFLNRKDLHTYRSVVDERPLLGSESHPKLVFCGPKPSSGFAVTQLIVSIMLKFYSPEANVVESSTSWDSVQFWHRFVEAQKYAFAMRTKLGDSTFLKAAEELAMNMTKSDFVDEIIQKIGDRASTYKDFGFLHAGEVEAFPDDGGTSHVAVIDADGNAISLTHSLNNIFGSRMRSPELGIVWNNHMDDFSLPNMDNNTVGFAPSKANFIEPGKRPMSSMCPTIAYSRESKQVQIVIGASGGPKIPSGVAQVLSELLCFNHSLKQAIDAPRLHNQFTPFSTFYEHNFPSQLVDGLRERGHSMSEMNLPFATVHAILRERSADGMEEFLSASNDPRRLVHSYPVGY